MSRTPRDNAPNAKDPLQGRTRPTIVAPMAAGLAIGTAVLLGGEVLLDASSFPRGANVELPILFLLALIAVQLAGILFVVSVRR